MGYDIVAYLNIDQCDVTKFISENNIDVDDWEQTERIANHFYEKNANKIARHVYYNYNINVNMHEIYMSHHSSFIRDDERFDNRRFQQILEKEIGKPFPLCLKCINHCITTDKDAIEIARGLRTFFKNDFDLMNFADWLEDTAIICNTYELSY